MTSATARVPAKINLSLGVGPVRDDGFHPLATVYQALDVHDEVRATLLEDGDDIEVSVHLESSSAESGEVPEGKDNLAVQAARALQEAMGVELGARLAIRKVIPVAGGMAGGSADAAAALVACNAIWGTGLSREELTELAVDVGSDVPFLLHGGTAIGGGRGETISPILGRGSYYWAIAVSDRGLATPAVFAEFDRLAADLDLPQPSVPDNLLAALRAGDPEALGDALTNDLSAATLSLRPDLRDVLAVGSGAGALGAMVSGSGPTCLFLAHDESHRLDLAVALASSGVCADVIQARGPVPGAHLIT
ncbi:MAG TPA: 4-(cytidine 5'-diphospho)-2-C-methyl-D-erythritol kinase [Aeromicrobium sp.]|nr:4-(cytidine 5'-diphospho)-2-C-methyl-D-erythritol kinase [Aeromicrobium sp.]